MLEHSKFVERIWKNSRRTKSLVPGGRLSALAPVRDTILAAVAFAKVIGRGNVKREVQAECCS